MDVISKPGLIDLLQGKSEDVRKEALAWYAMAKGPTGPTSRPFAQACLMSTWSMDFSSSTSDGIASVLIVYLVFPRRKLYIKALLTHKKYDRKEWKKQWP